VGVKLRIAPGTSGFGLLSDSVRLTGFKFAPGHKDFQKTEPSTECSHPDADGKVTVKVTHPFMVGKC